MARKVIRLPGTMQLSASSASSPAGGKLAKAPVTSPVASPAASPAVSPSLAAQLAQIPRWAWVAAALVVAGAALYLLRRRRNRRPFA